MKKAASPAGKQRIGGLKAAGRENKKSEKSRPAGKQRACGPKTADAGIRKMEKAARRTQGYR